MGTSFFIEFMKSQLVITFIKCLYRSIRLVCAINDGSNTNLSGMVDWPTHETVGKSGQLNQTLLIWVLITEHEVLVGSVKAKIDS